MGIKIDVLRVIIKAKGKIQNPTSESEFLARPYSRTDVDQWSHDGGVYHFRLYDGAKANKVTFRVPDRRLSLPQDGCQLGVPQPADAVLSYEGVLPRYFLGPQTGRLLVVWRGGV